MKQPSQQAIAQGFYKQIAGVWHKRCAGPAHEEPVYLPATDKYFYPMRNGKTDKDIQFISRCRLCQAWERVKDPHPGLTYGKVELERVQHFYAEAARRIGRNELARRTGMNRQSLSMAIDGKVKFVRKANVRKVMLELVSIQRKGEYHNSPWIIDAEKKRAERKRTDLRMRSRDIKLHDQEEHLEAIRPVKTDKPDPTWWHNTGQEWLPRWGEEMLGSDF